MAIAMVSNVYKPAPNAFLDLVFLDGPACMTRAFVPLEGAGRCSPMAFDADLALWLSSSGIDRLLTRPLLFEQAALKRSHSGCCGQQR